jgi:hypothetical protein
VRGAGKAKDKRRKLRVEMKFTKAQYRRLLDVVYAGMMVVNGDRIPRDRIQEYEEIEQYIYAQAQKFGLGHLVKYNEAQGRYYTTRDFDGTEIGDLIDQYHESIFWSGLALNLAKRDALMALKRKEIKNKDVARMILEREAVYREEFIENSLDNLYLQGRKAGCGGI